MAYGRLEVICGPMFSGKSTELIARARKAREYGRVRVLAIKPRFDARYAADALQSHDRVRLEAVPVDRWPDRLEGVDAVFADEVQFMDAPLFSGDVAEGIKGALRAGVHVVAAGLDADWRGDPFPVTARLLAMADLVHKRTAHCQACGRAATKTFKKAPNAALVELGERDLYEARCNRHWHTAGLAAEARGGAAA